jgi:hypothetical protein
MATRPAGPRRPVDLVSPAVAAAAAGLVLATAYASHPHQSFNRVRKTDRTEVLLPNWSFFAPHPSLHDHHVVVRTSREGEAPTPWDEVQPIPPRRWVHAVWFPDRRRDKALFDLVTQLLRLAQGLETRVLPRTVPYRVLCGLAAHRVLAAGRPGDGPPDHLQFAVVRYSGVDHSEEPEFVLVSPWEPIPGPADGDRRT